MKRRLQDPKRRRTSRRIAARAAAQATDYAPSVPLFPESQKHGNVSSVPVRPPS